VEGPQVSQFIGYARSSTLMRANVSLPIVKYMPPAGELRWRGMSANIFILFVGLVGGYLWECSSLPDHHQSSRHELFTHFETTYIIRVYRLSNTLISEV
jgi:hypothetical protein